MPMEAQTRWLRVLQTSEYSTVGGSQALRADVLVIAATHRDMRNLVADGRFREDLFYRLNVIPVMLPPLRDRRSDIAALAGHFVEARSEEHTSELQSLMRISYAVFCLKKKKKKKDQTA